MSEGRRNRPKRRRAGDTTIDNDATHASRLWRPCGDDWPTARIQAALDCWDMLPPTPTLKSSSDSTLPSFPFIVCKNRRRSCPQSCEGSPDASINRQVVLASMLPTIPVHPELATETTATADKGDGDVATKSHLNTITDEIKLPRPQQLQRDLTGAIVRINRGQYVNCTGIVTERMDVHLLQLDTVPNPLAIHDVYVLRYPDSFKSDGIDKYAPTSNDGDSEYIQKKYTGATVYVAPNSSADCAYWGTQGTVLRVLDLGRWYIINNPTVKMAFRASNFDVLTYSDEDNGDNHNNVGEITELCDDDNDNDDNDRLNVDACLPEAGEGEILPGQQPSALGEDKSSNKQRSFSFDRKTSNESPIEVEQGRIRSENEAYNSYEDTTSTSTCSNNQRMIDKERGINSQLIPLITTPSTKANDGCVVHVDGKDNGSHSVPVEDSTVVINKTVSIQSGNNDRDNDQVETSVELDKRISKDDTPEDKGNEEEMENPTHLVDMTEVVALFPPTIIDNEMLTADSSAIIHEDSTTKRTSLEMKREKTEIHSVGLPTAESIELAARLSAFDSFLFLAHGHQQTLDHDCDATETDARDDASIMSDQGEGETDDIAMARSSQEVDDRSRMIDEEHSKKFVSPASTNERNDIDKAKTIPRVGRNVNRVHANNFAQRTVSCLNRQHRESRNWPAVMALPGTVVLMDREKQYQKPLRIVPLEERIVRLVPGSMAERVEMSKRLSAFDDYMFLLGKRNPK